MDDSMYFVSAMTTELDTEQAIKQLVTQIEAQQNRERLDLTVIFLSSHFRLVAAEMSEALRTAFAPRVLLGCTGEGIIGPEQEVEREPAVSLVAARLPNVKMTPFSLQSMNWEAILADPEAFRQALDSPDAVKLFVLVADPFTTPMDTLLPAFNRFYPEVPIIGGMASGSPRPGGNGLLLNDQLLVNGAVGVALSGPVDIDVIVSQGCRPIGQPLTVTAARQNIILGLDGEPPLLYLQRLFQEMSKEEQARLQTGLLIGRAIPRGAEQDMLGRGDFLIRGLMGIDQENGALLVGDAIEEGETVQFHVRDAATAAEDFEMMLAPQLLFEPPHGGLLFSCNGRGTRLYDHPNGDISTIQNVIGHLDLAGFFCAGEIGPIGGQNFLHGHTASLVLFRPEADGG